MIIKEYSTFQSISVLFNSAGQPISLLAGRKVALTGRKVALAGRKVTLTGRRVACKELSSLPKNSIKRETLHKYYFSPSVVAMVVEVVVAVVIIGVVVVVVVAAAYNCSEIVLVWG